MKKTKTLTVTARDYAREIASGISPEDAMRPGKHKFRRATRFATPADIEKRNIKVTVSIRLDADIVDFFKTRAATKEAAPYQTQINSVLRSYIENTATQRDLLHDETFIAAVAERVRARA